MATIAGLAPANLYSPAVNVKSSPTASKSGVAAHAREWGDYSSAAAAGVTPSQLQSAQATPGASTLLHDTSSRNCGVRLPER